MINHVDVDCRMSLGCAGYRRGCIVLFFT